MHVTGGDVGGRITIAGFCVKSSVETLLFKNSCSAFASASASAVRLRGRGRGRGLSIGVCVWQCRALQSRSMSMFPRTRANVTNVNNGNGTESGREGDEEEQKGEAIDIEMEMKLSGSGFDFGVRKEMLDKFVAVANAAADAAGRVIARYFRTPFDISHKDDQSPVTIADRAAEEAMRSIILGEFPTHAIFGEEAGWTKQEETEFIWVLDPIDGTKSFITGKPLFGTLVALVHKDTPIVGIIDQPILRERWIGKIGERSTYNGQPISTRSCDSLEKAYLYTTSPHLFSGEAEAAFIRVRDKVKAPLYGCDCYAYALLSFGHVDLVIESGLKVYDFMALIPVIEGAGGIITDWKGQSLTWRPIKEGNSSSYNIIAVGDLCLHKEALALLNYH